MEQEKEYKFGTINIKVEARVPAKYSRDFTDAQWINGTNVLVCVSCGALVPAEYAGRHITWHEQIREEV
jgi:hypothetical protein